MISSTRKYFFILFISLFPGGVPFLNGQINNNVQVITFISDCQLPLPAERIFRKVSNNTEGRDMLFREIENTTNGNVFILGDIVGKGYQSGNWKSPDEFLSALRNAGRNVYGIPGNHEYILRPAKGVSNYLKRFPYQPLNGYCVRIDSVAVVMLNSNFGRLSSTDKAIQQQWYKSIMDSLDLDKSILAVIVCTHHAPFSNSKVVGSSRKVQEAFLPAFEHSLKTKLFITGHSHNLEGFEAGSGKKCLVIGGGGGINQPLYSGKKEKHKDFFAGVVKPRFFYLMVQRNGLGLDVTVKGFSPELSPVPYLTLSL